MVGLSKFTHDRPHLRRWSLSRTYPCSAQSSRTTSRSGQFFELGICVDRLPHLTQAIYQQGHWLGLHGYDHRSFATLNPYQLKQELEKTKRAIVQACPVSPEQLIDVRPPNGLFTPNTLRLLRQWGYRPVMWSVVPEDWVHPGISTVVQRVLDQVQNGSVIVLHDGYYGGRDVAETVDRLIITLQARGYQFGTIADLWSNAQKPPR